MNIRNRYAKVCLFLWVLGMCLTAHSLKAQSVIPVPLKMEQGTGCFLLSENTKLYINLQGLEAQLLENCLQALPVHLKKGKKKDTQNILSLSITEKNHQLPSPESYTLSVTPQQILIRATSGAGLFYGLQTLLQLARPSGAGSYSIASVEIEDTPRFAYRGLMLDVSRHFSTKEFIKKQIDALAYYKINRLHLHLTDAAGWRLEIKKYPLLTEFAAWRTDPTWKQWWNGGRKYVRFDAPGAYGGYYTQDDIREILEYARQHYITVIPEIEMPSHSEEVLAAYPQLSCSGEPYKNSDFCVGNEETFTFLENVLTEVMELFPSEYIHIGGDEAGKSAWKTCPKCQKRMKDEHLANVDELQSYLIHRIEKFLNNHGRHLLGWDEILQGGIAPNATVMSWRGEEGGIAAVTSGHRAIMTPGAYCYLDSYQDAPYSQPEAIGGYLPLKKVYSYNPVPASLTAEQAKLVYGVQGNLWVEYIPTPEHVEYMIYPRILALAETAWSAPERKSWPDFHTRALSAVADLQAKGYHPFDLKKEIGSRPESLQPVSHLALGKKVIYNSPYSSHYPAQGNTALTDGIRGDWTYGDGSWQGFISDNRLDVTIDMEKETSIHSVTAAFMQVVGAEVFLPETVVISISDDGTHFTELRKQHFEVSKETPIRFTDISWQGEAKGRYVRYQAQAGSEFGGWIFTDEIIVK
ncbi:family 20 glycosylhydrolase [Bacteroides xylanisolvens]|jgi:hexosaminidase|uniref:beta-N-acetylhexosaminidase n=1 Tax=Bacteroides xylanisolvens TaxID=371601 RepID=A0AAI9S367_9BACE|nr:family 20 glycosylhydrolase [Bacteroides xylanisolvens]KAA9048608.1 family 20 glycosylhydrolase [Bacteroides xylanisolvens]MDB0719062.1 family 20 glycosylhydrolase [Bacteroides xylanisolvens]MDB0738641.1 family 20 glycosylhydrolase [Bacteroides xylanisolvens]QDH55464.1 family 20 glycosylhydrolase [Bacteroides xylanisolvens]